MTKFNINELANGSPAEKIAEAWQEVLQNMQDPNRSYKPPRKLMITLTCTQDEKRQTMITVIDVQTKLIPESGIVVNYATGKNLKTGEAYAEEYKTVDARQINKYVNCC
ncbi:MAG: hypothetical protein WBH77_10015 [Saccharofermentanales bacterium]